MPTPRGTSQPTVQIFSSFFCKCILQGAIDFAELRMRRSGRGANGGAKYRTLFGVASFAPKPNF
jgi:hypothetical protein